VGVEGGPPSSIPGALVAQQPPCSVTVGGIGVVGLVEELRQAAPARPAGQERLLFGVGRPVLPPEAVENPEYDEVEQRQLLGGGCAPIPSQRYPATVRQFTRT